MTAWPGVSRPHSDSAGWRWPCGALRLGDSMSISARDAASTADTTSRETFRANQFKDAVYTNAQIIYKAGGSKFIEFDDLSEWAKLPLDNKWRSPVLMPRWASRITLKVNRVRVERVQDISYGDIKAEGLDVPNALENDPQCLVERIGEMATEDFEKLWDSINAKRGYGWDSNPWVWVVDFERRQ